MGCCGSTATVPPELEPTTPAAAPRVTERTTPLPMRLSQSRMETPPAPSESSQPPARSRSRSASTASKPEWTHHSGLSSQDLDTRMRRKSAPQPPQALKSSSSHNSRPRTQSAAAPKKTNRFDSGPPMPERSSSRSGSRTPATSYPGNRSLKSAVKQALVDHAQFRILVLGKRGSGKSALISAAFSVNMSAAPAKASNINAGFCPDDNRRLIVHEYSGLEPGDAQGIQPILDFIANRTDPNRSASERLHAIWICVPASDAIDRNIGEGLEDILSMRRVPVIVAFTKSDMSFPEILGSESGNFQYQDHARSRAYAKCDQLCRPLFRREPRDVPAELVSVKPQFGGLLNNLVVTTDRSIMGLRTASNPSAGSSSQGTNSRTAPIPLVWSVALRMSRDITIQAAVEIGRIRYWRNLWSSLDFADQPLKSCVGVIHNDIVEIWNQYDRTKYLSGNQFKRSMSHVVKDLAGDAPPSSDGLVPGDKFADWVDDIYRGSQENVRCVMGYIVDFAVIMDQIVLTAASNVTEDAALKVMVTHIRSGRRDSIHRDIRSFVTFVVRTPVRPAPQKDLVLQKIIDLIRQYCSA